MCLLKALGFQNTEELEDSGCAPAGSGEQGGEREGVGVASEAP